MLALIALALGVAISEGAEARFSWIPNDNTHLTNPATITTGYKLHYGLSSRNYTTEIDVGYPDLVEGRMYGMIPDLDYDVEYFFAATAYSVSDESDYSTEIVATLDEPEPDVCDPNHLDLCLTPEDCTYNNGFWWSDACHAESPPTPDAPQDFRAEVIVQ